MINKQREAANVKHATGFTLWILKWHIDDNTQIGMLARHISQDTHWPVMATSYEQIAEYLECSNMPERTKLTMLTAWDMYRAALKRLKKQVSARDHYGKSSHD